MSLNAVDKRKQHPGNRNVLGWRSAALETAMREIGAGEAETRLGQMLDWVEAGEEVVITRAGKPVARLLPPAPAGDGARVRDAIDGIRAMRAGVTLGGLTIKELMNEGRP